MYKEVHLLQYFTSLTPMLEEPANFMAAIETYIIMLLVAIAIRCYYLSLY